MAIAYAASEIGESVGKPNRTAPPTGGEPVRHGTSIVHVDRGARAEAGVWSCAICDWMPMQMGARAEFFHVVAGAMIVHEDGQQPITVTAGMSVYSPPGWTGRFRVTEDLTKSFLSFYPEPAAGQAAPAGETGERR